MGASLYCEPIQHGRQLDVGFRSEFISVLGIPREFDQNDVMWLEGLKAGRKDFEKALDVILETIDKHGRVRVWAEY